LSRLLTETRKTTPSQKLVFKKDLIRTFEPEIVGLPYCNNLADSAILMAINIDNILVNPKRYFTESKTPGGFGRNYVIADLIPKKRQEIHDLLKDSK